MRSVVVSIGAGNDNIVIQPVDDFSTKIGVGDASIVLPNDLFRLLTELMAILVEPHRPLDSPRP